MSIDICTFNPSDIPETYEKQLYREQAIPTPVQLLQHYIETAIENNTWTVSC